MIVFNHWDKDADDLNNASMAESFKMIVGAHLKVINLEEVSFYYHWAWEAKRRRIFIFEELC
jgi:hypothetical protein